MTKRIRTTRQARLIRRGIEGAWADYMIFYSPKPLGAHIFGRALIAQLDFNRVNHLRLAIHARDRTAARLRQGRTR